MSQNSNDSGEFQTSPNHNSDSEKHIHGVLDVIYQNSSKDSAEYVMNPISAKILTMGINLEKVRENFILEASRNER